MLTRALWDHRALYKALQGLAPYRALWALGSTKVSSDRFFTSTLDTEVTLVDSTGDVTASTLKLRIVPVSTTVEGFA